MDEDEWTDRNFGASANEMLSSDELSEFRLVNLVVLTILEPFYYIYIFIY